MALAISTHVRTPVHPNPRGSTCDGVGGDCWDAVQKKAALSNGTSQSMVVVPPSAGSGIGAGRQTHGPSAVSTDLSHPQPMVLGSSINLANIPAAPIGNLAERNFSAFGIDAYPTFAHKREICIDFIVNSRWCHHGSQCFRVHPKDKQLFYRKLRDRDSLSLFRAGMSDVPFFVGEGSESDRSEPPQASSSYPALPIVNKPIMKMPPTRNPGWDPTTGDWDFALGHDAWAVEDGSSSEGSEDRSSECAKYYPSRNSSETEDEGSVRQALPSSNPHRVQRRELCRKFQRGACQYGASCKYAHEQPVTNQHFLPSGTVKQTGSPTPESPVCSSWLRGKCFRGKSCRFPHPDVQAPTDNTSQAISSASEVLHPRPPFDQVCKYWLRGECENSYQCNYVHEDLTYSESAPRRKFIQVPVRTEPEIFSTVIYKHIKIKLTDGYEVVDVITGFETSWIYIGNVPRRVRQEDLAALLESHGELIDLRMPEVGVSSFITAKARFVSAAEASRVCSILDGLEALNTTFTARLSISINTGATTHLEDTSVRISWEAPSKTAYAGFSNQNASLDAIEKCRYSPLGKHLLKASVHTGLPAVGRFNIRLDGVPADIGPDKLKEYLGAEGVMWSKVNYTSQPRALQGIQRMLKESGADILDFEIMPPPYKGGVIVGWAHVATPAQAKALCESMHARKPFFTGHTRIYAKHIQSLEYSLSPSVYENARKDVDALAASAWRMGHLNVSCRPHPNSVLVRLGAEDMQGLSKLKAELDIILSGEVVREKGKVVWDRFFGHPAAQEFFAQLERQYSPLSIGVDKHRKTVRLYGTSTDRLGAKMKIMERVETLRKHNVHTIELDAMMIGVFMNEGLAQLSKELGEECVHLDLWNRALNIRGDKHAFDAARDAITRARRVIRPIPPPDAVLCPVCFDAAATPITLCCGHSWCNTCLIRYMMTAIDQKCFPLTCLGNDAKCEERIPLSCAKQLLPPADFEALIEAAFSTHIHRRLDEFCYCPTPDCQQIYRRVPRVQVPQPSKKPGKPSKSDAASSKPSSVSVGTTLQCPSCLVRICASCQTEAHDGLVCVRPEEGDSLFEEWMKNNDVKPCPGCKMPIEKAMGCHHVTCTVCSIHLCWVCLTPFHNGAGVYSHMLAIHGSFV